MIIINPTDPIATVVVQNRWIEQYEMKRFDPDASAFPTQENISVVVHECDCDENKAIELLQVRFYIRRHPCHAC